MRSEYKIFYVANLPLLILVGFLIMLQVWSVERGLLPLKHELAGLPAVTRS